jgi:hypothetical protein
MQVGLGAEETIRSKHDFERESSNHGVRVESYRGDNGVYRSNEFTKDLKLRSQTIKFSGVGAHHQNGVAERAIRTISESARSMMLHAAIHWPEAMSLDLWPFAVNYAVYLWNHMPRPDTKLAPIELYHSTKLDHEVIRSARVWGCPVYVLDPTIQDGKKLPRWMPKSRRGQFVGRSKSHAGTVGLIRNLKTGSITTQFHVVYDDWFTTVSSRGSIDSHENQAQWIEILATSRERVMLTLSALPVAC